MILFSVYWYDIFLVHIKIYQNSNCYYLISFCILTCMIFVILRLWFTIIFGMCQWIVIIWMKDLTQILIFPFVCNQNMNHAYCDFVEMQYIYLMFDSNSQYVVIYKCNIYFLLLKLQFPRTVHNAIYIPFHWNCNSTYYTYTFIIILFFSIIYV